MPHRQTPSLAAFIIRHAAMGFGGGTMLSILLIAFNISNLRVLIQQSDSGWAGALLLWISTGLTFASLTAGAAIMNLGTAEKPKPPRGMPIGPALIPARLRIRR